MNNYVLDDNMIKRIAGAYAEAEGSAIIKEYGKETLSPGEAKEIVDRIIKRAGETKVKTRSRHVVLKRVAAVILALGITSGMVFTFSEEARAAVMNWYREIIGDHIVYHVDDYSEDQAFTVPELGWIPEGFVLKDRYEEKDSFDAYYENSEGQVIDFNCTLSDSITFMELVTPEDNLEKIIINGKECDYYETLTEGEYSFLIWHEEAYDEVCVLGATIGKAEMIKIAENVFLGSENEGGK